ncbi:MAG: ABC transporter permease subunit [Rhizobiales bacterium]|nr:ABC transporter permease subunit [Hyphomicrobiales bacterium]
MEPHRQLRSFDPTTLLWWALVAILVILVVHPLARLVIGSLVDPRTGAFTLANFAAAYGRTRYLVAFGNSLVMGLAVTALCTAVAVPMAWAVSRTDMPGKTLVRILTLGAFITPPYLGALAWILLAGPNAGWLNTAYRAITGADSGLLDIFTFPGLVFIIAIYSYPYLFVFVTAALETVSSEMEDASAILGAAKWRTTLHITLPLALPAILGGAIITFLEAIALFGSPAMIAIPARYNVVTTQMLEFFSYPVRVEVAQAYALPLLAVTVALYLLQQHLIGRRGHVTMTGKGGERRTIALGRWRWIALGGCLFVCTLSVILPFIVIAQAAFAKSWNRGFQHGNFTLDNFIVILFERQATLQSMVNTFWFAAAAASLALGLALAIAYIVHRKLMPWGGVLSFLCLAPFVVPGIVLAIGFYAAYAAWPFALYGTAAIMILAFATRFLPIAYANSAAAIRGINPEMEEAVRILGGGRLTAIRRVVVPLLRRSLIGAWLLVFIPATRELSTAIFLYGPDTRVMSVMLLNLADEGALEAAAALGLVLLVAILVIVLAGYSLLGRDFMVRRSE